MTLVRWKLYDPTTTTELDFPVNPREGGRRGLKKTYTTRSTPQGGQIIFQGADAAPEVTFSGVILSEEHLRFLEDWYKMPTEARITDHLGQRYWAWLVEFEPIPRNRTNNAWSHTYTAKALFLGWADEEGP